MQSCAFCDTILRNVIPCALTSSRLDDFSDIVTYYCNDNNILWGGGELLHLKYPSLKPERKPFFFGVTTKGNRSYLHFSRYELSKLNYL